MKKFNNFELTEYNSYRIKSFCKNAYFPDNEADIVELYQTLKNPIVIGSGHNIILSKDYYNDDFIIFSGNYDKVSLQGNIIEAEAGVNMIKLSDFASEHGLSGLEVFYDIPSSLGGAVVMNAGAGGEEIKDLLTLVRYYNPLNNTFGEKTVREIEFEYRNSFFQRNPHIIVIKAFMRLAPSSVDVVKEKMERLKAVRWSKQPKDLPNAGSVFKRPPGRFVGPMMEELNLKGYAVGGAKVSEKHGGFIVNFNNCTGKDILDVITEVKRRVFEAYNVDLEIEQRII